ncbi:MAG: TonB family protein [Bryobacteraceae bacterium]
MNDLCDSLGTVKALPGASIGVAGLLFGTAEQEVVSVERCKPFSAENSLENLPLKPEYMDALFERFLASTKLDPDLTFLHLVGWYCVRDAGDMVRLFDSEIEFHNRRFRRVTDIAMVLKPQQHTNVSIELCSRLSLKTPSSTQDFRSGSLRLAVDARVSEPINVTMRSPVDDDYYLKVFQVLDSLDRAKKRESWKRIVLSAKRIAPFSLRPNWLRSRATHHIGTAAAAPSDSSRMTAAATPSIALGSSQSATNGVPVHRTPPAQSTTSKTPRLNDSTSLSAPLRVAAGKTKLPWIASVVLLLLVAGVGFALLHSRQRLSRPAGNALLGAIPLKTGFGMRVESQGNKNLLVRWDSHSKTVRLAREGVLHIDDGSRYRKLHLDPSQIANGSILYAPRSRDVSFRLEIFDPNRSATSETVRVVDGSTAFLNAGAIPKSRSSTQAGATTFGQEKRSFRDSETKSERTIGPLVATIRPTAVSAPPAFAQPALAAPNSRTKEGTLGHPPSASQSITSLNSRNRSAGTASLAVMDSRSNEPTKRRATQNLPPAQSPVTPMLPAAVKDSGTGSASTYVPARPMKQVMPNTRVFAFSPVHTSTDVEVEVRIDDRGRVTEAHVVNNGSNDNKLLTHAALAAAKEWIFEPAKVNGKNVASDHAIEFHFRPQ